MLRAHPVLCLCLPMLVTLVACRNTVGPGDTDTGSADVVVSPDIAPVFDAGNGEATIGPDVTLFDVTVSDGRCVANVSRGQESTDDLCSNGIDDDCNG